MKWRIITIVVLAAFTIIEGCRKDPVLVSYKPFFRTYQGNGDLIGRDILVTTTATVVCGFGKGANADEDFFLFFLDSAGNEIRRKFIGTSGNDQCWSFTRSNDNGYVIAGWSDANNPGVTNDIIIIKTDAYGNQQWSKIYGGNYNDLATHIIGVNNGYVVSGIRGENADENSWILRLDNNGDTLWTFAYGGNQPDGAMSVCDNGNDTYAIIGYTNSSGNGNTDGYLMIINDNGVLQGYYPFGTTGYEEPHDIEHIATGWVITGHAGTTDIHTHNVFLQFMDDNGSPGKYFTYGGDAHDGAEAAVVFRNSIYVVGRSASHDPAQDIIYIETDLNGNERRKDWIGTPNEDPGYGLYVDSHQTLITGYATNPTTGRKDLLLLRK